MRAKKILTALIIIVLLYAAVASVAHASPQSDFLRAYGISTIALDDLSAALGGGNVVINDLSMVIGAYQDSTFGNVIIWTEDNKAYCTADVMAFIFDGGMLSDASGMSRVFSDFCDRFDFDLYVFTGPAFTYYHPTSIKTYQLGNSIKEYGVKKMCWTKQGFLKEVTIKLAE